MVEILCNVLCEEAADKAKPATENSQDIQPTPVDRTSLSISALVALQAMHIGI